MEYDVEGYRASRFPLALPAHRIKLCTHSPSLPQPETPSNLETLMKKARLTKCKQTMQCPHPHHSCTQLANIANFSGINSKHPAASEH